MRVLFIADTFQQILGGDLDMKFTGNYSIVTMYFCRMVLTGETSSKQAFFEQTAQQQTQQTF